MSRADVLIDAEWVEAHLDDPNTVLVEVDEDTTAYDKGHIRNAVKIDWKKDLQDPVRRDFVDKEQFEQLLSRLGISNDDTVVLYGGNNNWFAAYAYWYFKLYGHENVKLLDGGRKKWELDSRELVPDVPQRPQTQYRAKDQNVDIRAFRDEVVAALGRRNLVDVRSPDEFAGRILAPAHLPQEQAQRPGHIPTARNIPWSKAASDDGTFKSDDELRELYQSQGVDFSRDTIAYCRIGERSAHTWFVLHEILDQPSVKNYDGSWTEYGSLVGVPIALGDEPGEAPAATGRAAAAAAPAPAGSGSDTLSATGGEAGTVGPAVVATASDQAAGTGSDALAAATAAESDEEPSGGGR
jgi:thiosulfate/3-mercaptopyruvate sulfurtransferase